MVAKGHRMLGDLCWLRLAERGLRVNAVLASASNGEHTRSGRLRSARKKTSSTECRYSANALIRTVRWTRSVQLCGTALLVQRNANHPNAAQSVEQCIGITAAFASAADQQSACSAFFAAGRPYRRLAELKMLVWKKNVLSVPSSKGPRFKKYPRSPHSTLLYLTKGAAILQIQFVRSVRLGRVSHLIKPGYSA